MDKVDFTFKRGGRVAQIKPRQAEMLSRLGLGQYENRSMADKVQVQKVQPMDNLDAMDKEQLHKLAKDRGLKVHHMAGADKVRAALREAK